MPITIIRRCTLDVMEKQTLKKILLQGLNNAGKEDAKKILNNAIESLIKSKVK